MALADLIARLEQDTESQVQAIQRQAEVDVLAIDAATEQAVTEAMARFLGRQRCGAAGRAAARAVPGPAACAHA